MFCPHCGQQCPDESEFCPECGGSLLGERTIKIRRAEAERMAAEAPAAPQPSASPAVKLNTASFEDDERTVYQPAASVNQPVQQPIAPAPAQSIPAAPVPTAPVYAAPAAAAPAAPAASTKKEFMALEENTKVRKEIRAAGIICYICAGATAALSIIAGLSGGGFGSMLDAIILLVLGLLVHLKYSRVAAILLAVYAIFNIVVAIIVNGTLGGWLIVLAAIFSILYTFKAEKSWQEYKTSNGL